MTRRTFLAASAALAAAPQAPAAADELPFRQIHLDFHTSELIGDVGADFDGGEFVKTLRDARVNSINVFAKCHHGWAYYDTKIAHRHPALKIDLLGEMVKGCKAAGIALNFYYSLVWDVRVARAHPEWRMLDKAGKVIGGQPGAAWPWVCMNTPYFDQVLAENKELLERFPGVGAWYDILKQPEGGCFCKWCVAERARLGLTDSAEDTFKHNKLVAKRVEQRLYELVKSHNPNAATFYNSRLVIGVRDELPWYSHIELESLPTGGWGYTHFQQRVRYMRTLGKDLVGMTGRFHKSWGDFGGLKNQAALDFECLNFLANGTKVCIGDQLHPRGRLDPATYARVGKTYRRVEALEPWCRGARPMADIGVVSIAATNPDMGTQKVPTIDQGFTNMLVELHQQFDILDTESDLSRYKVVIVPDAVRPIPALVEKIRKYQDAGGGLIVSHEALLDKTRSAFALDLGVGYQGPAKYKGEYLLLRPGAFPGLDEASYYLYQSGSSVTADAASEVLATYGHPYFDRSEEQFSSHKQTPMGRRTEEPVIVQRRRTFYIANPFFTSYAVDGYGIQKQVIAAILGKLLDRPAVIAKGLPSTAQVTMLEQPAERRSVVHVLYYPLTRRAPDIDIIEEPGLLRDVELKVRAAAKPARVELVPSRQSLPFRYETGYAVFTIPSVVGHQAVSLAV